MRNKILLTVLILLCGAWPALADNWKHAAPGYQFSFPRDHGAHPEYQIEWWYFTGNLVDGEQRFGFELTFFRFGISSEDSPSPWALKSLYAAHFALTDINRNRFVFFERLSRPPITDSGASLETLSVWNGDWRAELKGSDILLRAGEAGNELRLALTPRKVPVLHGQAGYSQKGEEPTNATNYYSLTRLQGAGELRFEGKSYNVTGQAWMDHEFGTSLLDKGQIGWDWLSLHLEDGRDLMLFQLRREQGARDPRSSGTLVSKDGTASHLKNADFQMTPLDFWSSPHSKCRYPIRWRVEIPKEGLDFEVTTPVKDQELRTTRSTGVNYWEGSVEARQLGKGYLELTGYCGR